MNHYIFDFLKSVCYAFGHLYGKREGISPEALMKECVHDAEQASYHPRKELNQAIAQHLMQGDLQENLDRLCCSNQLSYKSIEFLSNSSAKILDFGQITK